MSTEGAADDEITVRDSGLTVFKEFRPDDFPIPAIRFLISSEREEPVTLELSEEIPESVPMEIVGFHPDYDSENWTAFQDHHVEYERTIEPEEEIETVYGIRIDDPEEAEAFMTPPEIASVSPDGNGVELSADEDADVDDATIDDVAPETDAEAEASDESADAADTDGGAADGESSVEDIASPADDEAVKEMIAGDDGDGEEASEGDADEEAPEIGSSASVADEDADDVPELDVDIGGAEEGAEDAPRQSVAQEVEDATADDEAVSPSDTAGGAAPGPGAGEHESLAGALAAEIADGTVPQSEIQELRNALGVGGDGQTDGAQPRGSVDARIEHLQSRVADVAAYADAMEEFLDEEGTASQLRAELQSEVAALEDDLGELNRRVDATQGDVDAVADDVEGVETTLDDLEQDVRSVDDDVDAVNERVNDHEDRLQNVRETVDSVEADAERATSGVEDLRSTVDDIEASLDDVDAIEGDVDELRSTIDDLEERLDRLETVEDDLSDVQQDVADLVEWRSELGEMFN